MRPAPSSGILLALALLVPAAAAAQNAPARLPSYAHPLYAVPLRPAEPPLPTYAHLAAPPPPSAPVPPPDPLTPLEPPAPAPVLEAPVSVTVAPHRSLAQRPRPKPKHSARRATAQVPEHRAPVHVAGRAVVHVTRRTATPALTVRRVVPAPDPSAQGIAPTWYGWGKL